MQARSPPDIFARHVSSAHGYPLWTPSDLSSPEELRIGDVGVVDPKHGSFDVFFNICLSEDDPFHKANGVPDGFSPIKLSEANIKTVADVESPGLILKGSSVAKVGSDGAPIAGEVQPRINPSGTTHFNMSSTEGALLILPDGADRCDVLDTQPFLKQASRHAASWYTFAEQKLGRIISQNSIYVITGFHKARSSICAAYQNEQGDSFSAHFVVGAREGGTGLAAGYHWETARYMDQHIGPCNGIENANQAVFIRGFKVALKGTVESELEVPYGWFSDQPVHPSNSSGGCSWLTNAWWSISRAIGISSEDTGHDPRQSTVRVQVSRIEQVLPVFHPSDVINRYILQKAPTASVAITHDNQWGSLLDENLLKPEGLVQGDLLTGAINARYTIALSPGGVAYLQDRGELHD